MTVKEAVDAFDAALPEDVAEGLGHRYPREPSGHLEPDAMAADAVEIEGLAALGQRIEGLTISPLGAFHDWFEVV